MSIQFSLHICSYFNVKPVVIEGTANVYGGSFTHRRAYENCKILRPLFDLVMKIINSRQFSVKLVDYRKIKKIFQNNNTPTKSSPITYVESASSP